MIKPSQLSGLEAYTLMEAFHKAGLPPGVINVVNGRGDPVGNAITRSPDVQKISFTGSTAVGKMINRDATETMKRVTLELGGKSEEGAELLTGGLGKPEGFEAGNFVKPTLFAVRNDMTIAQQEIFGPVLVLITYRDEDEAVAIANDVEYGLHAYVYGANRARARAVANRLQAGRVMINEVVDDPKAPFGGFKSSGFGREFGVAGMLAFTETRAVFG